MDTTMPPVPPPTQRSFPLINRNFALLWTGQGISNIGDLVFDTTLILWIATQLAAGQSWAPLAVSGVLLSALIPTVLAGPWAGVFVDRWDKRRTMIGMDVMRAMLIVLLLPLTGLIPVVGVHPSIGWQLGCIYASVVLTSVCSLFFGPAQVALIGDVVLPEERARASGLGQMTRHLASLIGPPVAGPLFFTVGARWALLANAASFAVSFILITLVHAPASARSVTVGERGHALREVREGLRFFGHSRVLVTITVSAVIIMLGAGSLDTLDVFFVTRTLHASASFYGLISAAMGGGALLGAIAVSVFAKKLNMAHVFWISMLLCGLLIIVYSRMTAFVPAFIVLFLAGIPMAALNVSVLPLMLQVTPRELIGRVSGVLQPAISVATVGGIGIAGLLAGTVLQGFHAHLLGLSFGSTDTIFTAAGFLGLVAGVYAKYGLRGVLALEQVADGSSAHEPVELPA
jgi:MFS family permease